MSEPRIFQAMTFSIEASADGLTATLRAPAEAEVSAGDVISKLKEIGITHFDDGQLIENLGSRKGDALNLVVAQGVTPVHEHVGRFSFRVPFADVETGRVAKVASGQLIATVGPNVPGVDGRDIFGTTIPHQKADNPHVGGGVCFAKGALTATVSGNVQNVAGVVSVHPLLESRDGELATAETTFDGDVVIKAGLRDGRSIQATGCAIVNGPIEAATFRVDGWLHVKGGVVGRDKGSGYVGGDLVCRFASAARLTVRGDICVQNEIANSRVACTGRLTITNGSISGGTVTANAGITCHTLGSPAGTPTIIEVGMDQTLKTLFAEAKIEMDNNAKRATGIRERIVPLMERLKLLTPSQREKATELLYEADELDAAIIAKRKSLVEPCRISAERAKAEIVVIGTVHPGVILRMPGARAAVSAALQGPLRIIPRKVGNLFEIVIEQDGVTTALPTAVIVEQFKPVIERVITDRKAA
jgi:uncharacterized protein (DUF342 family)